MGGVRCESGLGMVMEGGPADVGRGGVGVLDWAGDGRSRGRGGRDTVMGVAADVCVENCDVKY